MSYVYRRPPDFRARRNFIPFLVPGPEGGETKIDADMADVAISFSETLDLDTASNRRKFIDGSGKPVDYENSGVALIIGLKSDGVTPSTFVTNTETGGDFTEYGALTNATTSPTD